MAKKVKLVDKTGNQVNVIFPRRTHYGVWVFTDPEVDLLDEPFVGEINTMIDMLVGGDKECVAYISHSPLPNQSVHLVKRKDLGVGWYEMEGTGIAGWLCPATLKYFKDYPDDLYARIEKVKK
jgi:hypothetical protein